MVHMELEQYVTDLQRQLANAAENGGEDTRAVAERLASGLDAATRLVLLDALSAAVAGAQSCTFDLQGKIEVDVAHASFGHVLIDGQEVPYNAQNGWQMNSSTQLELLGDACALLKNATKGISFDFPCDIIIAN